jgi:diacylglycerol kinase family enzyme
LARPDLRTRFIVNPRSGRAAQALPAVREFARRQQAEVTVTEHARQAPELARLAVAGGCDLVVAVGGDGTMNEIAGVLAGTPVTLGLIPCGSGDGLGRHLGIHGSVRRALEILLTGRVRVIDSGLADGHPFFTVAGLGFEAEIARRFNQLQHRGFFRYLTTSTTAFLRWQPQEFAVTHDGGRETFRCFTLAVANASQYGNNAYIAPGAQVDDGQLNLSTIPPITGWNALPLVLRLFHGTLGRVRGVDLRRSTRFVIERAAPGLLHTDGEVHLAGSRIEFTLRPASLRLMVPA